MNYIVDELMLSALSPYAHRSFGNWLCHLRARHGVKLGMFCSHGTNGGAAPMSGVRESKTHLSLGPCSDGIVPASQSSMTVCSSGWSMPKTGASVLISTP